MKLHDLQGRRSCLTQNCCERHFVEKLLSTFSKSKLSVLIQVNIHSRRQILGNVVL